MAGQIKLVMAQLNLLVGDIDANTDRVIANARRAIDEFQADVIVFPELTLTGYPPEDLLFRPSLKLRVDRALQRILLSELDITMVIGFPERVADKLYNSLTVIRGGEILANYRKQRLPSYEVFDEHRYFTEGDQVCVQSIAGCRAAFTICEDMWEAEPARQAKQAGAELLININASPYHLNKLQDRQQLLKQRSSDAGCAIVYVNSGGRPG